jgi:hypothetical protein
MYQLFFNTAVVFTLGKLMNAKEDYGDGISLVLLAFCGPLHGG